MTKKKNSKTKNLREEKVKNKSVFIRSFQIFRNFNKDYLYTNLYDLLFLLSIVLLIFLFLAQYHNSEFKLISLKPYATAVQSFANGEINNEIDISSEMLSGIGIMKKFIYSFYISLILFILFNITITSFIKGKIYSMVSKKENKNFILGFIKINVIWQLLWVLLLVYTYSSYTKITAAKCFIFYAIIYTILTPLLRSFYIEEMNLKTFFNVIIIALKKFYKFIIPVFVSVLIFMLVILSIFVFIIITNKLPPNLWIIITTIYIGLIMGGYSNWVRTYYNLISKEVLT